MQGEKWIVFPEKPITTAFGDGASDYHTSILSHNW